jgi:hypothetical protein
MFHDDTSRSEMHLLVTAVADVGDKIVSSIKAAESQLPMAHKAYNSVSELKAYLETASTANYLPNGVYKQSTIATQVMTQTAMSAAAAKASQFLLSIESNWAFLKQVRALDPNQLMALPREFKHYTSIPGLGVQLQAQWDLYHTAVQELRGEPVGDVLSFWCGMRTRTPALADIALTYLSIPTNSVDAERSFSVYNNVITDKRHNLTDENTKRLCGLYFNAVNGELF